MKYYNHKTCEVKYIIDHFQNDPQRMLLFELNKILGSKFSFFIYGGYIRDLMIEHIHNIYLSKKDIDIIVDAEVPIDSFTKDLPGSIGKTSFGGIRWYPDIKNNIYIDIWRIQENINIKMKKIKPTIENAVFGSVFNLNRLCFDYTRQLLIECEALNGIKNKEIHYYTNKENRDQIHAVRAALLHMKTLFNFDNSVIEMIKNSNWENNIDVIERYFIENHYTNSQISNAFRLLEKYVSNNK